MIELQPWSEGDLPLLERFLGDPEMMKHLGGPQSPEQILATHRRYLEGTASMFKIVMPPAPDVVGSIGYWEKNWRGEPIYETGWSVFPAYQGRGLALQAAAALVVRARQEGKRSSLHAFPSVDNPPSNAICKKLGFTLIGACAFEYPAGSFMRCNDWCLDLSADQTQKPSG